MGISVKLCQSVYNGSYRCMMCWCTHFSAICSHSHCCVYQVHIDSWHLWHVSHSVIHCPDTPEQCVWMLDTSISDQHTQLFKPVFHGWIMLVLTWYRLMTGLCDSLYTWHPFVVLMLSSGTNVVLITPCLTFVVNPGVTGFQDTLLVGLFYFVSDHPCPSIMCRLHFISFRPSYFTIQPHLLHGSVLC